MSGDDLLDKALEYQEKEQTEPEKIHHNAEVVAELKRRLALVENGEDARRRLVERFAHSACTAVVGLWLAHGGRPIEPDESPVLAKCLFEFFSKIR